MSGYPEVCRAMYCGRICCDGCHYRPALAEYYRQRGELAAYEARQDEARELHRERQARQRAGLTVEPNPRPVQP